jgi:hypothetical protein
MVLRESLRAWTGKESSRNRNQRQKTQLQPARHQQSDFPSVFLACLEYMTTKQLAPGFGHPHAGARRSWFS